MVVLTYLKPSFPRKMLNDMQSNVCRTSAYRSVWAVCTSPIRDWYEQYISVCWYVLPCHISVYRYDIYHIDGSG